MTLWRGCDRALMTTSKNRFIHQNWKRVCWLERESSICSGNWYPRENRSELRRRTISSLGRLNRGEIVAWLDRELVRGKREGRPVGIILADIDQFKNVNDSFGHSTGDTVLKKVAGRLKSDLRVYDGVGRYGGEEFLLILPGCDLATTVRRAGAIGRVVSATGVKSPKGAVQVTVSMGVTFGGHDRNANVEALLNEADTARYRAKENGRNRVEAY